MVVTELFGQERNGPHPEIPASLKSIAAKFDTYTTVLKPDKEAEEYWAGAPSVVRDNEGTFWMAVRKRSPEHPRGLRRYEIRTLKSNDGSILKKYMPSVESKCQSRDWNAPPC